jgi:hypothetical protein
MGQYCIEHEQPVRNVVRAELFVTTRERTFATAAPLTRVSSLRRGSARPAAARHHR